MTSTNIITKHIARDGTITVEINGRELLDVTYIAASTDADGKTRVSMDIEVAQFNEVVEPEPGISEDEMQRRGSVLRALEEGKEVVWRGKHAVNSYWLPVVAGDQPAWDVFDYRVLQ